MIKDDHKKIRTLYQAVLWGIRRRVQTFRQEGIEVKFLIAASSGESEVQVMGWMLWINILPQHEIFSKRTSYEGK